MFCLRGAPSKMLSLPCRNLFRSPNYIEDVATTVKQLERGDLKLRVRALETERALNRVQV